MNQQLFYFLVGLPRTRELGLQLAKTWVKELWLYGSGIFTAISILGNIFQYVNILEKQNIYTNQAIIHDYIEKQENINDSAYQTTSDNVQQVETNDKQKIAIDEQVSLIPESMKIANIPAFTLFLKNHQLSNNQIKQIMNVIKKNVASSILFDSTVNIKVEKGKNHAQFINLHVDHQDAAFIIDEKYKLHFVAGDKLRKLTLNKVTHLNQIFRQKGFPSSLMQECKKFYAHTPIKFGRNNQVHVIYKTPGVESVDYSLLMLAQGQNHQNLTGSIKSNNKLLSLGPQTMKISTENFAHPLPGARLSSPFGYRVRPFSSFHSGIDLAAPVGTPIRSASEGIVSFAGVKGKYGNVVMIEQGQWCMVYAHLLNCKVRIGDKIKLGQIVGLVGSTGRSTGPHLHFEIRKNQKPVDPLKQLHKGLGFVERIVPQSQHAHDLAAELMKMSV